MNGLSLFGADEASTDLAAPTDGTAASGEQAPPQSLYRKYRPQSFDDADLVGQEHVVRTVRNAIRLGRVGHAYLFCGPRGTGKTTTARLLAKAVNCLDPDPDRRPCNVCTACVAINRGAATDIIEIDAASNRGIDDIRDLRERVKYAPTQLRSKFYIVDEAHQITGAAANAFLKTLEEPPAHTRFVLATTDPEELLPTIVSRCQRFDFRRIGYDAMVGRLRLVAEREGVAIADDAVHEIARHATGSLRDALGLLEQLILHDGAPPDATPIDADAVRALLGISRSDRVQALLNALAVADPGAALTVVNEAVEAGEDPRQLNRQLVAALRDRLHTLAAGRSARHDAAERDPAATLDLPRLADLLRRLSEVDYKIRHSPYAHLPLEIALVESIVGAEQPPAVSPGVSSGNRVHVDEAERPTPSSPLESDGAQSTRLRDRVRGTTTPSAASTAPAPPAQTVQPEPQREKTPLAARTSAPPPAAPPKDHRPNGVSRPDQAPPSPANGRTLGLSVDQLADLWPRIRQDVKALNRRIDGLLSSFDPARVGGERIVLATPYEFHRDKLNTDEVRVVVEEVIGRLVGRPVKVEGVLVGDLSNLAEPPGPLRVVEADPGPGTIAEPPQPAYDDIPDEVHDKRLQAARNIFDAVEDVEAEIPR